MTTPDFGISVIWVEGQGNHAGRAETRDVTNA
jgi:hypothetical protein